MGFPTQAWSAPAEPAQVPLLRRQVVDWASRAGIRGTALQDLRLAVSEAVTNAVLHGFHDDRPIGTVRVTVTLEADTVRLVVDDDGIGLHPRDDSPGAGLGFLLLKRLTDSITLTPRDTGGLSVAMAFALRQPGRAPGGATGSRGVGGPLRH